MREINFRGKTKMQVRTYNCGKKDNEWFEVDPETVGQYTGLKDKNGNRIYEGDIIKCAIEDPCTGKIDRFYNCYVKYCKTTNAMGWYGIDERKVINKIPPQQDYVEIIGNIHDNKELLGE